MAEPWEPLKDEILSAIEESAKDFAGELKISASAFMREQAISLAKEKWRELQASTPEEKEIARSNIRHLQGQVGAEIARLQLAASERAGALFERVLTTAASVVVRMAPSILSKL